MVGSGRNRTSCPQGPRLQRGDGTSLNVWLRDPGLHRAVAAYETAWVPNRPTRQKMGAGLLTPSLAAVTSAVSRNGGCLTCRSPHLVVPPRFERAPEAALVRHPCGGRPRSRSAVANHPIAFQAMPIARSVDLPYWRMAEHSKPMPCAAPSVFKAAPASLAGSPSMVAYRIGSRSSAELPVVIARARHPNRESRATSHANSLAGTPASPPSTRRRSERTALGSASCSCDCPS